MQHIGGGIELASQADFAVRGTSAQRVMTFDGRCAGPAHSSTWPSRSTTATSQRPSHSSAPATTANSAANETQLGQPRGGLVDLEAISTAGMAPSGHHHHGTRRRSRYRTVCEVTRELDTRPRVVCGLVSTRLAIVRLDPELPLPSRAHAGDAGVDLFSAHNVELAPTPRPGADGDRGGGAGGMVGLVHPRSGLAARVGLSIVSEAPAPSMRDIAVRSRCH